MTKTSSSVKRPAKFVVVVCLIGFFASFTFAASFYFRNLPKTPHPEIGRTYPLNNHGNVLYMTWHEELQQRVSFIVAVVLAVVAIAVSAYVDPFDQQKNVSPFDKRAPWNHRWGP